MLSPPFSSVNFLVAAQPTHIEKQQTPKNVFGLFMAWIRTMSDATAHFLAKSWKWMNCALCTSYSASVKIRARICCVTEFGCRCFFLCVFFRFFFLFSCIYLTRLYFHQKYPLCTLFVAAIVIRILGNTYRCTLKIVSVISNGMIVLFHSYFFSG